MILSYVSTILKDKSDLILVACRYLHIFLFLSDFVILISYNIVLFISHENTVLLKKKINKY